MPVGTVELFGLRVHAGTRVELLDALRRHLDAGDGAMTIATINAQFIDLMQRDAAFAAALRGTDICVADGMPIVWLARTVGRPVAERIPGRELWLDCVRLACERRMPVQLVGARAELLEAVQERLEREYSGVIIAGRHAPSAGFDAGGGEADAMIAAMRVGEPGLVLVGLGAPARELLLERLHALRAYRLGIGVGAAFELYTGAAQQAPGWMARHGWEWLWRWMHEPVRLFTRYTAGNARFLRAAWREWRGTYRSSKEY